MRLSGRARAAEPRGGKRADGADRPGDARRGRFAEALRSAARATAERLAAGAPPGSSPAASAARSTAARRAAADGKDAALSERRRGFGEDERAAPPRAPAPLPVADLAAATAPELRALVRALPVAVDAARLRDGAPLALSFGRSLDVELRPSSGGVELVLRPDGRLARACQAELPRVVAALAARGVSVARAEVRARAGAPGGPRVDLPAALR